LSFPRRRESILKLAPNAIRDGSPPSRMTDLAQGGWVLNLDEIALKISSQKSSFNNPLINRCYNTDSKYFYFNDLGGLSMTVPTEKNLIETIIQKIYESKNSSESLESIQAFIQDKLNDENKKEVLRFIEFFLAMYQLKQRIDEAEKKLSFGKDELILINQIKDFKNNYVLENQSNPFGRLIIALDSAKELRDSRILDMYYHDQELNEASTLTTGLSMILGIATILILAATIASSNFLLATVILAAVMVALTVFALMPWIVGTIVNNYREKKNNAYNNAYNETVTPIRNKLLEANTNYNGFFKAEKPSNEVDQKIEQNHV
jgi:6-pyruvoyl-tetrahydropterin synthase